MSRVALGQPAERFYKVIVAPDHFDWTYKTGENVKFTISVLQNGNLVKNACKPLWMECIIHPSLLWLL